MIVDSAHELTHEQRELERTTARLLADRAGTDPPPHAGEPASLDRSLWEAMTGLGLLGLALPEVSGGGGAGLLEVCLVAEQVGRVVAAVPFVGTEAVLAVLAASGPPELTSQLLAGTLVIAPAWSSFPASVVPRRSGALVESAGRLTGVIGAVPFGSEADWLLGFAETKDGAGLSPVLVELTGPGVDRSPVPSLDVREPLAEVRLAAAPATVLASGPDFPSARILTVLAAELVGVGQRALDGAVGFARERRQFGRAIGSFQAIKHMLADRHVQLDAARLLVHGSATAGGDDVLMARTALVAACDAAEASAGDALQVHGGIGFTWEHASHVLLKRVRARRSLLGSSARQLESVADHVLGPAMVSGCVPDLVAVTSRRERTPEPSRGRAVPFARSCLPATWVSARRTR